MLYGVMHAVVPPLARAVWRPVVEGLDNVPLTGPVIVASNHLSFADSVVIPIVTPAWAQILLRLKGYAETGTPQIWDSRVTRRRPSGPRATRHPCSSTLL